MPRSAIFAVPDDDEARIEIQVSPVQVADFAAPHAGMESDRDDCLKVWRDAGGNQAIVFLQREIAQSSVVLAYKLYLHRRDRARRAKRVTHQYRENCAGAEDFYPKTL